MDTFKMVNTNVVLNFRFQKLVILMTICSLTNAHPGFAAPDDLPAEDKVPTSHSLKERPIPVPVYERIPVDIPSPIPVPTANYVNVPMCVNSSHISINCEWIILFSYSISDHNHIPFTLLSISQSKVNFMSELSPNQMMINSVFRNFSASLQDQTRDNWETRAICRRGSGADRSEETISRRSDQTHWDTSATALRRDVSRIQTCLRKRIVWRTPSAATISSSLNDFANIFCYFWWNWTINK